MTTVKYKGFTILTRPYRLSQTESWTVELEIRRNRRARPFTVDERYSTEQEADARCADIGRRIIDGRVPAWSADSLRGHARLRSILLPQPRQHRGVHPVSPRS